MDDEALIISITYANSSGRIDRLFTQGVGRHRTNDNKRQAFFLFGFWELAQAI